MKYSDCYIETDPQIGDVIEVTTGNATRNNWITSFVYRNVRLIDACNFYNGLLSHSDRSQQVGNSDVSSGYKTYCAKFDGVRWRCAKNG